MTDREKSFVLNGVRSYLIAMASNLPKAIQENVAIIADETLTRIAIHEAIPLKMLEWTREEQQEFLDRAGLGWEG